MIYYQNFKYELIGIDLIFAIHVRYISFIACQQVGVFTKGWVQI